MLGPAMYEAGSISE